MRGKPEYRGHVMCEDGITPADAGKTCKPVETYSLYRDHPRGCGENRVSRYCAADSTRITPADAGKTV